MTDILDRIGQIIHPAAYLVEAPDIAKDRAREKARMVLEALRDPSDKMVAAVKPVMPTEYERQKYRDSVIQIWQAMIDTALTNSPGSTPPPA